MADYATTMRVYVELMIRPDNPNVNEIPHDKRIALALPKIFDFYFPIFDENYRTTLENNIIRKFYLREIGSEVVGLFKFNLETWLNINMPYYNKLYRAINTDFNLLNNVDYVDKYSRSNDSKKTTNGKVNNVGDKTKHNTDDSIANDTAHVIDNGNTNGIIKSHTDTFNNQDKTNAENKKSDLETVVNSDGSTTNNVDENTTENIVIDDTKTTDTSSNGREASKNNQQSMPQNRLEAEDKYTTEINVKNSNNESESNEKVVDHGTNEKTSNHGLSSDGTTHNKSDTTTTSTEKTNDRENITANSDTNINSTSNETTNNVSDSKGSSTVNNVKTEREDSVSNLTNNEQQKFNNLESYAFHRVGKNGGENYGKIIKDYMDAMINVDNLILAQMSHDLFMGVIV